MDMRDKIRERRQERMRQLTEQELSPPLKTRYPVYRGNGMPPGWGSAPDGGDDGPLRAPRIGPSDDPRLQDPEYVWKHREATRQVYGAGETYSPGSGDPLGPGRFEPPTVAAIWRKLLLSAVLFAAVWGLFRLPYSWAEQGRAFVTDAMTTDTNFAAVQAWYAAAFGGTPSLLPAFHEGKEQEARKASSAVSDHYLPPVAGKIVVPFAATQTGVTLETAPRAEVKAVEAGRVMTVNATSDQGYVVMIQHSQGIQTVYGGIAEPALKKNDWVERGAMIGHTSGRSGQSKATLYFSVKKDDHYINPADVIPFD